MQSCRRRRNLVIGHQFRVIAASYNQKIARVAGVGSTGWQPVLFRSLPKSSANILDFIDPKRFLLLPNTSGARNAEEAVRLAQLAASAGLPKWIKLEIHPDPRYLLPDPVETLAAAEILVKEGFTVLPYINADPVLAK